MAVEGHARVLRRQLDSSRTPNAEALHENLTRLRADVAAVSGGAVSLADVDAALSELADIWNPAASGTLSEARRLASVAVAAVVRELDVYEVYAPTR